MPESDRSEAIGKLLASLNPFRRMHSVSLPVIEDVTTMPIKSLGISRSLLFLILFLAPLQIALGWQQRVHYRMDIDLDTSRHQYAGRQILVYVNNSPDTIRDVYYHLYYEAFKPGSMMDIRDRSLPDGGSLGIQQLSTEDQGAVRIDSLRQDGADIRWTVDETVLHAELRRPIAPGDSTMLEMAWLTRIPRVVRRGGWMNREGVEYSMSQWYPKLAAYDRTGWHQDDYVLREFYGVFGTFDVAITLPASYVVGGTGTVMNPDQVKCGYELSSADTTVTNPASGTGLKTWRFHAENVHDFAWVADREYSHHITHWRDMTLHFLFKRSVAPMWQHISTWTQVLLAYYGKRFGEYGWPQFTVAMAGDRGMEYPQMIMITGYRDPVSLAGVLAHEMGHQWFYGMIGTNETQEAWMDEGFAQYMTDEARRKVFGLERNPFHGLDDIVYAWNGSPIRDVNDYYTLATAGYGESISTYHDWLREGATSGLPYSKGETVLRMLEGMLGTPLFDRGMHAYVEQWRFRQPDARDFEHAIEETSGLRLDWFFNQWVVLNRSCDYAALSVTSDPEESGFRTKIALARRDEVVMPLDVTLRYEDGSTAVANIPVEDWAKPDVDIHLPRWKWVAPEYSASFITPKRVVEIEIDTSMMLADLDRTNNIARAGFFPSLLPPSYVAWYRRWDLARPYDRYSIRLRPTIWYSQADAVQLGLVADGGYSYDRYNSKAGIYYNLGSKRVDYDLRYATPTDLLGRLTRVSAMATNADGVQLWSLGLSKVVRPFYFSSPSVSRIEVQGEREVLVGGNYPNKVAPWSTGGYNTIALGYSFTASNVIGMRRFKAETRFESSFASTTEFSQWKLGATGEFSLLGRPVTAEIFAGASIGDPPAQRLFNAAGATSREMHANIVQRFAMNANPRFAATNHLVLPTQGYLLSLAALPDSLRFARNLLDARVEIGLPNPFDVFGDIEVLHSITFSLYGAAGWLFPNAVTFSAFKDINAEAGVAATIDPLATLFSRTLVDALASPSPVRLGFYLPLAASSKLLTTQGVTYRWAISVSL